MKIFTTDQFVLPLPEGHTFPMVKYRRLRERLEQSCLVANADILEPPSATDEELSRVHDSDYLARMCAGEVTAEEMRRIGFPWSLFLVERSRRSNGATMSAMEAALSEGLGINLAGGTHHAFRDHGEGYCLFNDSVVAIRHWQSREKIRRAVVVDLDVHQGNGTAALCRLDDSIFTFSIHGEKNYPIRKEMSNLDIALPDNTTDTPYLDALAQHLPQVIEQSRPDLVIYLAGADPFVGDRLGRLALTKPGLAERDRMVFDAVQQNGLPLVMTMGGGYAKEVEDTVDIHWATIQGAIERWKSGHS